MLEHFTVMVNLGDVIGWVITLLLLAPCLIAFAIFRFQDWRQERKRDKSQKSVKENGGGEDGNQHK